MFPQADEPELDRFDRRSGTDPSGPGGRRTAAIPAGAVRRGERLRPDAGGAPRAPRSGRRALRSCIAARSRNGSTTRREIATPPHCAACSLSCERTTADSSPRRG